MKVKMWWVFFTDTAEWETPVWVMVMAETEGAAWFTAVKYLQESYADDGEEITFDITQYTINGREFESPCVIRSSLE